MAVPGPRCSIPASTPPTSMLPSKAQKMKNLVLSHTHGCSTMTFVTRNHSHIGDNKLGNAVGIHRIKPWAASITGSGRDVYQIQNQEKSIGNSHSPYLCQAVNVN